jgi:hypothetical protein
MTDFFYILGLNVRILFTMLRHYRSWCRQDIEAEFRRSDAQSRDTLTVGSTDQIQLEPLRVVGVSRRQHDDDGRGVVRTLATPTPSTCSRAPSQEG